MAHPLTAHLGTGDFDAALVADDTLVTYPLVLAAIAFEVLGRAENSFTEQAVPLRLECPVVYRLRLGYLTVRPTPDLLR